MVNWYSVVKKIGVKCEYLRFLMYKIYFCVNQWYFCLKYWRLRSCNEIKFVFHVGLKLIKSFYKNRQVLIGFWFNQNLFSIRKWKIKRLKKLNLIFSSNFNVIFLKALRILIISERRIVGKREIKIYFLLENKQL